MKSNIKILDIGCGTGILSPLFSNTRYIGIDIDEKLIAFAKKRYPYKFMVMDADKMNFENSSFDIILIVGVIHHVDNRTAGKMFQQIKRILKKEGRVLIIEAIPPIGSYNYLGRLIRSLDEGHNIRELEDYKALLKRYFIISKSYKKRGGLVDYGVLCCLNKYSFI